MQGEHGPDPREAAAVAMQAEKEADGMGGRTADVRKPNWTERLTAPFRFGVKVRVQGSDTGNGVKLGKYRTPCLAHCPCSSVALTVCCVGCLSLCMSTVC